MAQKSTATGLTKKEQALLEVLLDPNNRLKSITDICGLVPCDRKTFYKAFKKPKFADLYAEMAADLSRKHLGQVMNAFVKEATRGSFQHGKVLLEMAGVYTEKSKHEVSGPDGKPLHSGEDLSSLSVEELTALVAIKRKLERPTEE